MVVDKIRGDQDSRDEKEEREDDKEAAPPYREPEEEEQEGRWYCVSLLICSMMLSL